MGADRVRGTACAQVHADRRGNPRSGGGGWRKDRELDWSGRNCSHSFQWTQRRWRRTRAGLGARRVSGILSPGNASEMQIIEQAPAQVRLKSEHRCSKQVLRVLLSESDFKTSVSGRTSNSLQNPGELRGAGGPSTETPRGLFHGFVGSREHADVLRSSLTSSQVQTAPPFSR